jgi:hypothetical protein
MTATVGAVWRKKLGISAEGHGGRCRPPAACQHSSFAAAIAERTQGTLWARNMRQEGRHRRYSLQREKRCQLRMLCCTLAHGWASSHRDLFWQSLPCLHVCKCARDRNSSRRVASCGRRISDRVYLPQPRQPVLCLHGRSMPQERLMQHRAGLQKEQTGPEQQ